MRVMDLTLCCDMARGGRARGRAQEVGGRVGMQKEVEGAGVEGHSYLELRVVDRKGGRASRGHGLNLGL